MGQCASNPLRGSAQAPQGPMLSTDKVVGVLGAERESDASTAVRCRASRPMEGESLKAKASVCSSSAVATGCEHVDLLQAGVDATPALFTICSVEGLQVLYQNSASLGYAGDLRSTQELSGSDSPYLMQLLSLQPPQMVEEVMEAIRKDDGPWVRVMQVPPFLAGQAGYKAFEIPATYPGGASTGWPKVTAPSVKTLMEGTSSQVVSETSTAAARNRRSDRAGIKFDLPPSSSLGHAFPLSEQKSKGDDEESKGDPRLLQTASALLTPPLDSPPLFNMRNRRASSSWLVQELEHESEPHLSAKSQGSMSHAAPEYFLDSPSLGHKPMDGSRTMAASGPSFGSRAAPLAPHSTTRNRMAHLLAKTGNEGGGYWSNPGLNSRLVGEQNPSNSPPYHSTTFSSNSNNGNSNSKQAVEGMGMQDFYRTVNLSGMGAEGPNSTCPPGPVPTKEKQCWHEVTFTPFKNPKTGQKVFMVSQTDVTQRCQLEQRLMKMTEAQLHMLENMFPRHILERIVQATSTAEQKPPASMSGARTRMAGQAQQPVGEAPKKMLALSKEIGHTTTFHDCVTIMFTDIVGFTTMSESVQPQQVMAFLNELFSEFDELVAKHKVSKVETAGDCFIICAGILEEDEDGFIALADNQAVLSHTRAARRALNFAAEMMHVAQRFTMPNGQPVRQRVGIHSGPVASGLIGNLLPKFSLFGDTMNTASRMESTSLPGRIQVSEATHALLQDPAKCWECTGGVEVKGKGTMVTFLLSEDSMRSASSVNDDFPQLLETSTDILQSLPCRSLRASLDMGAGLGPIRKSLDLMKSLVGPSCMPGAASGRQSFELQIMRSASRSFSLTRRANQMASPDSDADSAARSHFGLADAGPSGLVAPAPHMRTDSSGPIHRLSIGTMDSMHTLRQKNLHMSPLIDTLVGTQVHLGLLLETLRSEDEYCAMGTMGRHSKEGGDSGPASRLALGHGSGTLSKMAIGQGSGKLSHGAASGLLAKLALGAFASGPLAKLALGGSGGASRMHGPNSGPLAKLDQVSDDDGDRHLMQLT